MRVSKLIEKAENSLIRIGKALGVGYKAMAEDLNKVEPKADIVENKPIAEEPAKKEEKANA